MSHTFLQGTRCLHQGHWWKLQGQRSERNEAALGIRAPRRTRPWEARRTPGQGGAGPQVVLRVPPAQAAWVFVTLGEVRNP